MTTPRTHSLVSIAAALTLALTLGGCASARPRPASDAFVATDGPALAVRFDNTAGDYVHVYLVGARRQWLLGRVEAGEHTTLRFPDAALVENEGWMRLAVLVGQSKTMRAADDPRAALTSALPATEMLTRRWVFSPQLGRGQLSEIPLGRAHPKAGPR
jgi:hypothetical protein